MNDELEYCSHIFRHSRFKHDLLCFCSIWSVCMHLEGFTWTYGPVLLDSSHWKTRALVIVFNSVTYLCKAPGGLMLPCQIQSFLVCLLSSSCWQCQQERQVARDTLWLPPLTKEYTYPMRVKVLDESACHPTACSPGAQLLKKGKVNEGSINLFN